LGEKLLQLHRKSVSQEKKHTPDFPIESIKYCLEEAGLEIDELDAVVFYDKPLLKFERLLQTYYAFAPKGLISFLKAMLYGLTRKFFLKNLFMMD
jgi:carbamoyltransferase